MSRPSDPISSQTAPALSQERRDTLRAELPHVIATLDRRRADQLDASVIDDCVALNWLKWHGGDLKLTSAGERICEQARTAPDPVGP
jgi:hypothetical protein